MHEPHSPETSRVRVDTAGRVVVPAELRQQLGINPGCDLILSADEQGIHLQTFAQAIHAAQQALAPYRVADSSVTDELIRERRAEARKNQPPTKKPPRA
jgi:AbrB family looped-hinge helix DNA binding protein